MRLANTLSCSVTESGISIRDIKALVIIEIERPVILDGIGGIMGNSGSRRISTFGDMCGPEESTLIETFVPWDKLDMEDTTSARHSRWRLTHTRVCSC